MRRHGAPPRADKTYKARPGAYAILPRGADILVTYQAGTNREFQLPGGGLDPGEGPITALHREVAEETGWRISPMHKLTSYQRYVYMPEYDLFAKKVCHIYLAMPVFQIHPPIEPDHTAVWMPIAAALFGLASSADRQVLAEFLGS